MHNHQTQADGIDSDNNTLDSGWPQDVVFTKALDAVNTGNLQRLKQLLPLLQPESGDNTMLLCRAVGCNFDNNTEMVDAFLASGFDVNQGLHNPSYGHLGACPIHYANSPKMIRHLHARGADLDARSNTEATLLQQILDRRANDGVAQTLRTLLELGADPMVRDTGGNTLLLKMVDRVSSVNNEDAMQTYVDNIRGMVEALVNAGLDINARNLTGATALTEILRSYHDCAHEIIGILLDNGARFDPDACQLEAAAIIAIEASNTKLLQRLFDLGLSDRTRNAKRVLDAAFERTRTTSLATLLDNGWSVSAEEIERTEKYKPEHVAIIRARAAAQAARAVVDELGEELRSRGGLRPR